MTFYEWLLTQRGKYSLAGAIVKDLDKYADHDKVKNFDRFDWLGYFIEEDASFTAMKALEMVWKQYEIETGNKVEEKDHEINTCDIPSDDAEPGSENTIDEHDINSEATISEENCSDNESQDDIKSDDHYKLFSTFLKNILSPVGL